MITKKRCTFMIETEVLDKLQSIAARTGLSKSEQIRRGIRWWLESREWPPKNPRAESGGVPEGSRPSPDRASAARKRRR
jgi:metal-responsive CopG/Arc/MetJ family transcriptional regulator